jgi:hypothetical protein
MHVGIKEFVVHDRLGELRVTGELLSEQRFGGDGTKLRWTDMALYAVTETVHDGRLAVTVECEGCVPSRVFTLGAEFYDQGAILCGLCGKPFIPSEQQADQPIRYALEVVARSVVYHRVGGPCVRKRHMITTVGDVKRSDYRWDNLTACDKPGCRPPDLEDMRDNEKIAEERTDPHVYACTDAASVITRLYRRGEISGLAAKLLRESARKDPDIAKAMRNPRRI